MNGQGFNRIGGDSKRPATLFVREITHNSVDAKATRVRIALMGKKAPKPAPGTMHDKNFVFLTVADNGVGMHRTSFAAKISVLAAPHTEACAGSGDFGRDVGHWSVGLRGAASQLGHLTCIASIHRSEPDILSFGMLSHALSKYGDNGDMVIPIATFNKRTKEWTGYFQWFITTLAVDYQYDGATMLDDQHGGYMGNQFADVGRDFFRHPPVAISHTPLTVVEADKFVQRVYLESKSPTCIAGGGTAVIIAQLKTPLIAIRRPLKNRTMQPVQENVERYGSMQGIMVPYVYQHTYATETQSDFNRTSSFRDNGYLAKVLNLGGRVEMDSSVRMLFVPAVLRERVRIPEVCVNGEPVACDMPLSDNDFHMPVPEDISLPVLEALSAQCLKDSIKILLLTYYTSFNIKEGESGEMSGYVFAFNDLIVGEYLTQIPDLKVQHMINNRQGAGCHKLAEKERAGRSLITYINIVCLKPVATMKALYGDIVSLFLPDTFKTNFDRGTLCVITKIAAEYVQKFVETQGPEGRPKNSHQTEKEQVDEEMAQQEAERKLAEKMQEKERQEKAHQVSQRRVVEELKEVDRRVRSIAALHTSQRSVSREPVVVRAPGKRKVYEAERLRVTHSLSTTSDGDDDENWRRTNKRRRGRSDGSQELDLSKEESQSSPVRKLENYIDLIENHGERYPNSQKRILKWMDDYQKLNKKLNK